MKKIFIGGLILLGVLTGSNFVAANDNVVDLYFFYGETCFYCKDVKEILQKIERDYPTLKIHSYEVFGNKGNAQLLVEFLKSCNKETSVRVPAIFIGDKTIIEYLSDESMNGKISAAIEHCLEKGCSSPIEKVDSESCSYQEDIEDKIIDYPFIGKINLSKLSLPVLTVALAAIDGFNPCAMWVLLFLLALLINVRSRKKMIWIGGTFIAVSGVVYYLLLSAWLNLFLAISYVNLVRIIIGVLALGAGVWQIKHFITFKPGVCEIAPIGSKWNEKLTQKANQVVKSVALPATFLGIVVLAFGVNLIEFFCSAGLPAIYTQILSLNNLSSANYYLYLLLYTLIFMLDDMVIFTIAAVTLSKLGFTDKYAKYSALIGGIIIFALGLLLIFKQDFLMFG